MTREGQRAPKKFDQAHSYFHGPNDRVTTYRAPSPSGSRDSISCAPGLVAKEIFGSRFDWKSSRCVCTKGLWKGRSRDEFSMKRIDAQNLKKSARSALLAAVVLIAHNPPVDAAERYFDHGDGTISDQATGLMWEKKIVCDGCLQDLETRFAWSSDGTITTIWDWIDEMNSIDGQGYAGHSDWRIPSVKELFSIVDHSEHDPAVSGAFQSPECEARCDSRLGVTCSCSASADYWSATTFADFTAHALVVTFEHGFIDDRNKTTAHHVRAVRSER